MLAYLKNVFMAVAPVFACGPAIVAADGIQGTFAIQNVATGMNLRPFDASKQDRNRVILYNHHAWKCLTWEFLPIEGNSYRLKNYYTAKAVEPAAHAVGPTTLQQRPISGGVTQIWEFVDQPVNAFLIRHKTTGLYITASSHLRDSELHLQPRDRTRPQSWRLIRQRPWF